MKILAVTTTLCDRACGQASELQRTQKRSEAWSSKQTQVGSPWQCASNSVRFCLHVLCLARLPSEALRGWRCHRPGSYDLIQKTMLQPAMTGGTISHAWSQAPRDCTPGVVSLPAQCRPQLQARTSASSGGFCFTCETCQGKAKLIK